jgi:TPR repeat protein
MDSPRKFINLNTPIINLIKFLTVATSFILAAPIFADTNQETACYSKYNAGDYDTALSICTKAAEQGYATAQTNLGWMFDSGQGVPQDDKQAIYWYTKAAERGHASAQHNLGWMFANGQGTPKNNVLAYVWWNIAAAQGHKFAEKNRGIIEGRMTLSQIAEAQKLSGEYYAKYVK